MEVCRSTAAPATFIFEMPQTNANAAMMAYQTFNEKPAADQPPMSSEVTDGIAAQLAGLAAQGHSPENVAKTVMSTLRGIQQELAPIIGQRGLAALYKRSLHLAKAEFAWLPESHSSSLDELDLMPLTTVLAKRSAAEAAAAGARLLQDFDDLLVTLIGPSLTRRLLRSVWINSLSASSALDNMQ